MGDYESDYFRSHAQHNVEQQPALPNTTTTSGQTTTNTEEY